MTAAVRVPFTSEDEWRELRRGGIGASDVAALVGLSPWGSPFTVFCDKIGALPDRPSEEMLLGKRLEASILDEYAARTGRDLTDRGAMFSHPTLPWARVSVDALTRGDEDLYPRPVLIEAKASTDYSWHSVPIYYQCQAQWGMWVLDAPRTVFTVLHQGSRLETYHLPADPADQKVLLEAAEQFWYGHVLSGVIPAVDGFANPILGDVWPQHNDSDIEIDETLVSRLRQIRNQLNLLEEERNQVEAEVKAALGENAIGTIGGLKRVSWKTQRDRRIDLDALRDAEPAIADKFTVEGTRRVLRLHGKKVT